MATWFEITFTGDPTEADFQHVSDAAALGMTSGQLINDPDDGIRTVSAADLQPGDKMITDGADYPVLEPSVPHAAPGFPDGYEVLVESFGRPTRITVGARVDIRARPSE